TSGNAYCWGSNNLGQIGINSGASTVVLPTQIAGVVGVGNLSGLVSISAGAYYACALSNLGHVYCWGDNSFGQLGNGTFINSSAPVEVAGVGGIGKLANIKAIAAGDNHVCALTNGGNVYCWGENVNGQLGIGVFSASVTTPTAVIGSVGIGAISAGYQTSCALHAGGALECWGYNAEGEVGNGVAGASTNSSSVILAGVASVSNGGTHSCAVLSGAVYCWGFNDHGQLGDNSTTQSATPVQVKGVGGVGFLSSIASVTAGGDGNSCAVSLSGSIYCWGDNSTGSLGVNNASPAQSLVPVQVVMPSSVPFANAVDITMSETGYACATNTAGNVFCWGRTDFAPIQDGAGLFGP
ncbi:MAG: RCC1 domain-containing protein, partial [Bdellovibrionales bacterium]